MKKYLLVLKYALCYKSNIAFMVLANIFYSVFHVFSLTLVIPFLSVLFQQVAPVTVKPDFAFSINAIIDTFNFYLGRLIATYGPLYALIMIALMMIVLNFLGNLFRYLAQFFSAPIRAGMVYQLRKELYSKLISLPLSFFSKIKKGDVLNRFGTDVQEIEWSVVQSIITICKDPIMIIVFLITMIKVSFPLTIITLLIFPLVGYLISRIGASIQKNSAKLQQLLASVSAIYDETIGGLRIIKGYNAIDHANKKFQEDTAAHFKMNKKIFRVNELGAPLVELLSVLTLLVVLLIGGIYVLKNSDLSGELFLFFVVIFARIIPPARHLASMYYTLKKGIPSLQRILQILDADEKIYEKENALSIPSFSQHILYREVYFSYHEVEKKEDCKILQDVSFEIKKGEKVALIGSSGAGKSTLVDLLPRFYDLPFGKILIDNKDIKDYKIKDLRSLFGMVSQDVILFHDTVFNNIAFGRSASREEVEVAAKAAFAHDFIMEMENGYDTVIGDRGMTLSGGQRQRISIARALLKKPEILILDEATSALDYESELAIQKSLNEAFKNHTVIIIAHREETLRNMDKIITVKDGKIYEIIHCEK
ncbi:MAG: ABC transporter ATP-binding protein/permease [Bacteroidetes bacterium]|nr:ABC transporter ATP-binding protein/permease [Bacteroidota bacterium]MCL2303583.1 ABC transporter ATP-binding protein/permease [Lentimicrobiaceae bacterium]